MSDAYQNKVSVSPADQTDEGWWASVMSDENQVYSRVNEINCQPCSPKTPSNIDWECAREIFERDEVVLLDVTGYNRGGLLVHQTGLQGFVPVSHLIEFQVDASEEERQQCLTNYVGRSLYLKIIECEQENERIVFSERAALAGEGKRKELFSQLSEGNTVCGVVTNITNFGAFVDLGGVEGLIHVSELSWGRVENPADLLEIGQKVRVIILQVNQATSRIALSMKRLSTNPWERLSEIYQPGDIVSAIVTSITRFGVFARLEDGVEGLIHISNISEKQAGNDLQEQFALGQQLAVKIVHLDAGKRRLGLGLISEL